MSAIRPTNTSIDVASYVVNCPRCGAKVELFPKTDLVKIAEREVIEATKAWWRACNIADKEAQRSARIKLFDSVTLLEARERQQIEEEK